MDKLCHEEMKVLRDKYLKDFPVGKVMDLGSFDVNGTFKDLFSGWDYVGVDIAEGSGIASCNRISEIVSCVTIFHVRDSFFMERSFTNPFSEHIVKNLLRFENYKLEVQGLFDLVYISKYLPKKINSKNFPAYKKTQHSCYKNYYSEESKKIIEEKLYLDLEKFGYKF